MKEVAVATLSQTQSVPRGHVVLWNQEFTKTSTNIEQFSYVSKLVALTDLYMQLRVPLVAALRAAEADLR